MKLDFLGPLLRETPASVGEWVQQNFVLPPSISRYYPGPVSLARQPWMFELLQDILDPSIHYVTIAMGTQNGKSTFLLLGMGALLDLDPLPFIWAGATKPLTQSAVNTKILPFINANPILAEQLGGRKRHKAGLIEMEESELFYLTARMPADTAEKAAAYVFVDEAAKIQHPVKSEGHPIDLLGERCKSFGPRHCMVMASTPAREDDPFWKSYLAGDQRKWYVPCPECGAMQAMEFTRERVRFSVDGPLTPQENIELSARYICENCGAAWNETQKNEAIARGEWRPTAAAPRDHRSYSLNSLYSFTVTIGDMARKFWEAQRERDGGVKLQNFVNSWCARPFAFHAFKLGEPKVRACIDTRYRRKELPPNINPYYVVTCFDPGLNLTHWVTTMVSAGGELWVLDWGTLLTFTSDRSKPGEITGPASLIYRIKYGNFPHYAYIDSGNWTMDVYRECEAAGEKGKLRPTKGVTADHGAWGKTPIHNMDDRILYKYSDFHAKNDLYAKRLNDGDGSVHLPADTTDDLIAGLVGQERLKMPRGGDIWKPLPDDHYGDCLKMAAVSWWMLCQKYEPLSASAHEGNLVEKES